MFALNFWNTKKYFVFLSILCMSTFIQGCDSDSIVSDGNGQPYEGLTTGDATAREPAAIDADPALDVRDGGFVQSSFNTHYICTDSDSAYLDHIRFGWRPNGDSVVIVRRLDSSGYITGWTTDQSHFNISRVLDDEVTLVSLETDRVLDQDGGRIVALYHNSQNDGAFREVFECVNTTTPNATDDLDKGRGQKK